MASLSITRRGFLVATGGLLAAAACASGDDDGNRGGRAGGDGPQTSDHHAPVPQGKGLSALLLSSDLHAAADPQRLAFALAADGDYASGPPARIAFAPQGSDALGEALAAELHQAGLPEGRGIYTVEATLPQAGVWVGAVGSEGETAELAFEVRDQAVAPVVGQAAPRAASPTVDDPLGVDPICTRDPDCDLHSVSLDPLIGSGRPVAALFATPARCSSQYCGPVLDELLDIAGTYQDRVDIVHVEIYRANTGTALVPTVDTWGLPSEPWLYGVDPAGLIVARLDGAFGGDEITRVLDRLV